MKHEDLGRSLLGEHEFVAFSVKTEGEMDETIFFLGFANESAAVFQNELDAFADVVALEAQAGPGAFAFAATVDSDGGAAKSDFAPHFHFEGEIRAKSLLVKADRSEVVGRPDGVFYFLDLHAAN